jgi:predicted metal-dependent peptidase
MDISTAKFRLTKISPFFGTLILNLPVIETDDPSFPTLGVDGESLLVNINFWNNYNSSPKKQLGLITHEVGHLFLGHIWRRKGRNGLATSPSGGVVSIWNIAGDYVINGMIDQIKGIEIPPNGLINHKYDGWTTEEVYDDLMKNMPKAKEGMSSVPQGVADQEGTCDKSKWNKNAGKNPREKREKEAKWKDLGKQAMEKAKQKGDVPAGLERLFKELEPKEDWRRLLEEYAQPFSQDYSFSPADRRFLDSDFLLPDIKDGKEIDWIAIAVDTSGSIGEKELNSFLSEVKGIMEAFDKIRVKVTFCDASATPFVELDEWDSSALKVEGGGGTSFIPVFNLIKKEETEPKALIYFTDLYGEFPNNQPGYDTLWVDSDSSSDKVAPFGKTVQYRI